jgi:hypothetical protein
MIGTKGFFPYRQGSFVQLCTKAFCIHFLQDLERQLQARKPEVQASPATQSVPPEDRAERRQVTVMFSDLVGSTALHGGRRSQ